MRQREKKASTILVPRNVLPFHGRPGGAAAAEVRRVTVEPFGQPVQAGVKPDAPHHVLPVRYRHAALW